MVKQEILNVHIAQFAEFDMSVIMVYPKEL